MTELLGAYRDKIELAQSFLWQHGINPETHFDQCDTVCYRVETDQRYKEVRQELGNIAVQLGESMVDGRLISVFCLNDPLMTNRWTTRYVEVPQPDNEYKEGIQHLQFVVGGGLKAFHKKYEHLPFDVSGLANKLNPLLELKGNVGRELVTVKFHGKHMGEVIELEQRLPLATSPDHNGHAVH